MLNETIQRNLFDKFDKVVIKNTNTNTNTNLNLSSEDLDYCLKLQDEFNKMIDSLNHFQNIFEQFQQSNPAQKLCILDMHTYCPDDDFPLKKKETKITFINLILRYFSNKYYLKDIDLSHLAGKDNLDYSIIVNYILSEFGDLVNYGIDHLKAQFKDKFAHSIDFGHHPQLISNKIAVHHCIFYDSWSEIPHFNQNAVESMEILLRAFSYFDSGDIDKLMNPLREKIPFRGYNKVDISRPYELNLEKIKGIKFYKNRRVDLIFNSAEYARQFFQLFDMASPRDNRR